MQQDLITTNIILYCRKWAETVHFYRDGLQLPICFSTDWFVEFFLTESSRLSVADEEHASIKGCGGAGITLTLQVSDIDRAWEQAEAAGLRPTSVRVHPWEARVFHVSDPEGRRIELWQSRPSSCPGSDIERDG